MEKILVIGDEDTRQRLAPALRGVGHEVLEVSDSKEAIRLVVEEVPNLILVGEEMPAINGVELLNVIRSFTDSLIVVVGSGEGEIPTQTLLRGADVYLERSMGIDEIVARINALTRRHGTGMG